MKTRRGVDSKSVSGNALSDALSGEAGILILQGGATKEVAPYPSHDGKEKIPGIYGGSWGWQTQFSYIESEVRLCAELMEIKRVGNIFLGSLSF
jgi:hypothetical protein